MDAVVKTEGLCKSYGRLQALIDLDLEVERGEVLGFLGPNGAGKTTTLRLLLGLLHPTQGRARVFGFDSWSESTEVRRRTGYLPGDVRLYDGLTGEGFLRLMARLRGTDALGAARSFGALAERLALDLGRRIRTYSKGNRQKLGLVQALMHEPPLLILDEPTSALDPLIQEELYQILLERSRAGATVFFSSHVLSEIQKICHRVAIVRAGRLLRLDRVESLRSLELRNVSVRLADEASGIEMLHAAGYEARRGQGGIELRVRGALDPLIKLLARQTVLSLEVTPVSLEEVFFEFYRDGDRPWQVSDQERQA